jgi:hypothetical protein
MKHSSFKPEARWDKPLMPNDAGLQNPDCINQQIEVLALFKSAKILPRIFFWNNKIYKIKKITYNWQERLGSETISYFSVSTGIDFYQISFNNTSFNWQIDKIIQ